MSKQDPIITPEQLKIFDIASEHPYECKCALCKRWWSNVPKEEDEESL